MKKQKGSTISAILVAVWILAFLISWPVNAYKLTQCDFEANYKCEVIHGAGLFGPLSIATVWFGTDK